MGWGRGARAARKGQRCSTRLPLSSRPAGCSPQCPLRVRCLAGPCRPATHILEEAEQAWDASGGGGARLHRLAAGQLEKVILAQRLAGHRVPPRLLQRCPGDAAVTQLRASAGEPWRLRPCRRHRRPWWLAAAPPTPRSRNCLSLLLHTLITLRIRRFSYRWPDFFDTTGTSGTVPLTAARQWHGVRRWRPQMAPSALPHSDQATLRLPLTGAQHCVALLAPGAMLVRMAGALPRQRAGEAA